MQAIKSKFNVIGWLGLSLFAVLPILSGIAFYQMEQSNKMSLQIWETNQAMSARGIGEPPSFDFASLHYVSPWALPAIGALMLLGLGMMIIGRDSYVQEISK